MKEEEKRLDLLQRRVLKKLDWNVIPCLAFLWFANFIDRSNIGNARIAGLEVDLGLQGNQFNIALAGDYVLLDWWQRLNACFSSYIVVDIPANLLMKKVQANRWLPMFTCVWGISTIGTGFTKNFSGLVAARFFLGFSEGSLFPCMVLYMSSLYPRHKLQFRMSSFYSLVTLSGAFGGLLAAAILNMDGIGSLAGWRWIFILEGIITVLFGLLSALILPPDLKTAKFLNEEERHGYIKYYTRNNPHAFGFAVERGGSRNHATESPTSTTTKDLERISNEGDENLTFEPSDTDEVFEWGEVRRGIFDFQTWVTGFVYFANIVALNSYSLFLPTIVSQLGFTGVQAQIRSVYPYIPSAALTAIVAFFSDRMKIRGPFILGFMPISIAGYIVAIVTHNNTVRYAALFLVGIGTFPCSPGIISTLANNHSGYYKRAASLGLQIAIGSCGGVVATFVYTTDQAPRYVKGNIIVLTLLAVSWFMMALNMAYCWHENKARAQGKRQLNLIKYKLLVEAGKTKAPIGDRDPAFRFTL